MQRKLANPQDGVTVEILELLTNGDWRAVIKQLGPAIGAGSPNADYHQLRGIAYALFAYQTDKLRDAVELYSRAMEDYSMVAKSDAGVFTGYAFWQWPERSWAIPAYIQLLHQNEHEYTRMRVGTKVARVLGNMGAAARETLDDLEHVEHLSHGDSFTAMQFRSAINRIRAGGTPPQRQARNRDVERIRQRLQRHNYTPRGGETIIFDNDLDDEIDLEDEELLQRLSDADSEQRARAAAILGIRENSSPQIMRALFDRFADGRAEVRDLALFAVSTIAANPSTPISLGSTLFAEILLRTLRIVKDDRSYRVRASAANLLGRVAEGAGSDARELKTTIHETLKDVLDDRDKRVRLAAIEALGCLGEIAKSSSDRIAQCDLGQWVDPGTTVSEALVRIVGANSELGQQHIKAIIGRIRGVRSAYLERLSAIESLIKTDIERKELVRVLLERLCLDESAVIFEVARNELMRLLDHEEATRSGIVSVEL